MNTYCFYFSTDFESEITYSVKARSLSQALKIFYRESELFFHPVKIIFPKYDVTNAEGKWSHRLIPLKHFITCPYKGGARSEN